MLGIDVSAERAQGWFGKGKTSAILSMVMLLALIGGIAFGVFTAMNVWGGTGVGQPGAPAAPSAPAPVPPGSTGGTIQVPDGPKVKVSFDGPSELKMVFEEMGIKNFQFYVSGQLSNISDKTVIIGPGGVAFFVDGEQQGMWNPMIEHTLKPGESVKVQKGLPVTEAKQLTVKVTDFRVKPPTATTPPETVTPTGPEPTTTPEPTQTYTENPVTPEEVVIAFFHLVDKEDKEALNLLWLPPNVSEVPDFFLYEFKEMVSRGGYLLKVEIEEEKKISESERVITLRYYYIDRAGDEDDEPGNLRARKTEEGWKLDFSN